MRRLCAMLGIFLVLAGLGLYDGDLSSLHEGQIETIDGCQRLVLNVPQQEGYKILKKIGFRESWREQVGDITLVYAYSPNLKESKRIKGKRINLMIALRGDSVVAGYPILCGSY